MAFFKRKKKSESQRLLNRPKNLFGRRRDDDMMMSSEKAKAVSSGTKRNTRLFGKDENPRTGTPPATPNSPFNITVVTSPPSPPPPQQLPHVHDEDDYEEELSELTTSVKRNSEAPLYSSSLIPNNEPNFSPIPEENPSVTDATDKVVVVTEATTGEPTAERAAASKPNMISCTSDTTSDVVTKILGMMDEACTSGDRNAKKEHVVVAARSLSADPVAGSVSSTATSRRSDMASVMSSVFSGVLTRPSTTTAGESSSSMVAGGGAHTWGIAPTQTDDEDSQAPPPETRESVQETLKKSRGTKVTTPTTTSTDAVTRTPVQKPMKALPPSSTPEISSSAVVTPITANTATSTAAKPADNLYHQDEHEDFELVLGRQLMIHEPAALKRRSWLPRGREFQEEKKDDETAAAARIARYRAVFGADPTEDSPRRTILPSFVKRLSMNGKQPRRETKQQPPPQQQQQQLLQLQEQQQEVPPPKPAAVTPNSSLRSLRPGLSGIELEESLRGVRYLEEELDEQEQEEESTPVIKLEPKPVPVISPEIENVPEGPISIDESKRSRSWNQTFQILMGSGKDEPKKIEMDLHVPNSPTRTRSSPMRLLGFGGPLRPPKPIWKSAMDPTTGVPYYYHRLTRQTTWTKPKDFDKQHELWDQFQKQKKNPASSSSPKAQPTVTATAKPSSAEPKARKRSAEKKKRVKERQPTENQIDVSGILRKKSPRDFIPDVWENKQKIVQLLTVMNPPNAESIENLMKQYEGREEELLLALEDLVELQPFDEPIRAENSIGGSEVVEDLSVLVDADEGYNRIRTEATATSGFLSQKTEKTEKHRNTGPMDPEPLSDDQHAPLSTATSFSIESQEDIPREDNISPRKKNLVVDYAGKERVKHPAVPRNRELVVEEFTTSRLKKENYDMASRNPHRRASHIHSLRDEAESSYNGDNDETDDGEETFGGDSISALSEGEGDFQRREQIDLVRQRVVEEANESKLLAPKRSSRVQPTTEWKQSELDKVISEKGYDAVASYVAGMKESNTNDVPMEPGHHSKASQGNNNNNARQNAAGVARQQQAAAAAARLNARQSSGVARSNGVTTTTTTTTSRQNNSTARQGSAIRQEAPKTVSRTEANGRPSAEPSPKVHHPPFAQRKFGARSQLQHNHIGEDSSWDSDSSYESDDYTETSYDDLTEDDPSSLTGRLHRKEFVC